MRELPERVKYWALSPTSEDTDLGGLSGTPGLEISKGLKGMITHSQDWDHWVSYEVKKSQRSKPATERMLELQNSYAVAVPSSWPWSDLLHNVGD